MKMRRFACAALVLLFVLVTIGGVTAQPKVRFLMKDFDADPNIAAFIDLVEKGMAAAGTPVKIEVLKTPAGDYAQKVALMVMSGGHPRPYLLPGRGTTSSPPRESSRISRPGSPSPNTSRPSWMPIAPRGSPTTPTSSGSPPPGSGPP